MDRSLRIFGISSKGLVTPGDFEALAKVFRDAAPGFVPEKMGHCQPFREEFDVAEIRSRAERAEGAFSIYWRSRKSETSATQYVAGYMHGTLIMDADPDIATEVEIEQLFLRISTMFQPALLMIHMLNPMDWEIDATTRMRIEAVDRPTFSTHWKDLTEGLPKKSPRWLSQPGDVYLLARTSLTACRRRSCGSRRFPNRARTSPCPRR